MMIKPVLLSAAAAVIALTPVGAGARPRPQPVPSAPAQVQVPYASVNLPSSGQVRAFYASSRFAPIWFQGNTPKPAANEMINILQRSPLDGIVAGPQYAAQVQAAVNQAGVAPSPQTIAFAEHSLSEALVFYAQAMDRPIPGMIYGYEHMKPTPQTAQKLLAIAAGSPSLSQYVASIANPNTVYTSIRDAAWRQMQAAGTTTPDPRAVANLDRARGMPARGRFVLVNPATATLTMFENGAPVDSMKVVVGDYGKKRNMPTPMITSMMYYVVHNPYWNAPDHLVRENIAPLYLKQGKSYFDWRGYKVMSDWTREAHEIPASQIDWKAVAAGKVKVRVRQDPGEDNFMGKLKFPFANSEDIFLHDTDPADRKLFARSDRAESNGCVRLEDAHRFARWLLGHEPVEKNGGAEEFEQMPQGVPVYVTYLTAQPVNGELTYVKDIYGRDPAGGASTQVAVGQ